jgi:hypothetical protein
MCTAGSELLVQHMLEVAADVLPPSEAMLAAVRTNFHDSGNAAMLAPVVGSLPKAEVLQLLPRLLQVCLGPQWRGILLCSQMPHHWS